MKKLLIPFYEPRKICGILCGLFLLVVSLGIALATRPVLAQEEGIELGATYPRIESVTPGAGFGFTVALRYRGSQARTFDLQAVGPPAWTTYVTSSDGSIRIAAIKLEPNQYYPNRVKVIASPPASAIPEPKEYKVTLMASSGAVRGSIELTAVVMPTYSLDLVLGDKVYYQKATASRDNIFSLNVANTGSGALTNIRFSAKTPEGWVIEFKPDKIDSLTSGSLAKVSVNIKPAAPSSAEQYQVTLVATTNETQKTVEVMVLVEKLIGVWVWAGAVIAIVVVAGFIAIFRRLGRQK